MITDEQAEKANDFIRDEADTFARAKAERIYLEEFRKSKKAMLIQDAPEGTIQTKESYAYAHEDYKQLLNGLKVAVEKEEKLRWQMIAAQTKIEIWRTQQANSRRGI